MKSRVYLSLLFEILLKLYISYFIRQNYVMVISRWCVFWIYIIIYVFLIIFLQKDTFVFEARSILIFDDRLKSETIHAKINEE